MVEMPFSSRAKLMAASQIDKILLNITFRVSPNDGGSDLGNRATKIKMTS